MQKVDEMLFRMCLYGDCKPKPCRGQDLWVSVLAETYTGWLLRELGLPKLSLVVSKAKNKI